MTSITCPSCSHQITFDVVLTPCATPPRDDLAARLPAVGQARNPRVRDSMTADMAFAQRFARFLVLHDLWSGELTSAELWSAYVPWAAARSTAVGYVPDMTPRRLCAALLRLGATWRKSGTRRYSVGAAAD